MWQVGRPTVILYTCMHLASVAYHLRIFACIAAFGLSAEHNVYYASQCIYKCIHPGVYVYASLRG